MRRKKDIMAKKSTKQKSTQTAASAQQDVVGLITTLVEKLVVLETKIDSVLSRISNRPQEAPRQQPPPAAPPQNNRRPMHKAVCADCGKTCEVPFRPSAGRSVYCKSCFVVRKRGGTFMPRPPQEEPKIAPPVKASAPVAKKKKAAKKKGKKK